MIGVQAAAALALGAAYMGTPVMKVVQYSSYGHPPDTAQLVDVDPGSVADNEVLIAVEAAPVQLNDLYLISGKEGFRLPLPSVPGNLGVGKIVDTGAAVTKFQAGDRVFLPRRGGTWCEQVRSPAAALFRAPLDADPVQLSLLNGNALTSYLMLKDIVDLTPGEWIVQNAANSSCGQYLIKLARLWGYKTVNVVRRRSAVEEVRQLGGDVVIVDGADLAEAVMAQTGGAEIALGIDAVGGDATERIASCLGEGGTVASYGYLSGEPCNISPWNLMFKDIKLVGYIMERSLVGYIKDRSQVSWTSDPGLPAQRPASRMARQPGRTAEEQAEVYDNCARLIADGTLSARIAGVYPLEGIRDALIAAAKTGDERTGKVILVPGHGD